MSATTSSGDPKALSDVATAFHDLSNLCQYLVTTEVVQGGGAHEYDLMNLATNKPQLSSAWDAAIHQVDGMLLTGVWVFADASLDVASVSQGFSKADGRAVKP